jgi:hypothetical protein
LRYQILSSQIDGFDGSISWNTVRVFNLSYRALAVLWSVACSLREDCEHWFVNNLQIVAISECSSEIDR